jgi:GntR family transcriptional regulator
MMRLGRGRGSAALNVPRSAVLFRCSAAVMRVTIWYNVRLVTGIPRPRPDLAGRVPVYLQVAQLIRQEIMSGRYRPGDMLPSEHAHMAAYGVSQSTVRAALAVLREEGLVVTRKSAGSSVGAVPPPVTVTAGPGDVVIARMPTPAERQALGLAEGVPVIAVQRPGRAEELFDAGRARIIISGLRVALAAQRGPDHQRGRGQRRGCHQPPGHGRRHMMAPAMMRTDPMSTARSAAVQMTLTTAQSCAATAWPRLVLQAL